MQEKSDRGKEGFRNGKMKQRRDEEKEGYRKGWIQD